ncbi:MAG: ATP-binding cassette domain-containing protein, partial [Thermoplasmata archaeon]
MGANGTDSDGVPLVLAARNLRKLFPIRGGVFSTHVGDVHAVDGVSFDIREGETVGLVGESGCGKTTVGRLLLRLIDPTSGHAFYRPPAETAERIDRLYRTLEALAGDGSAKSQSPELRSTLGELDKIAQQYSIYRRSQRHMQELRAKLQIVFQDPFSSLSPRMMIKDVLGEPLEIHHLGTRVQRQQRATELLKEVGMNVEHLYRFPHEFSGGQRQRIG